MKKTIKKKKPMKKGRNYGANEGTLINIRALKSRVKILEGRVDKHYLLLNELQDRFDAESK